MGKIWVEICLISARGLPRSSLWKFQWYAVGWIDPNNKYCTNIHTSGNLNPVWKTKFTHLIDTSESDLQDIALHVEVYSRYPLFLREKLQGTATVVLKEFLAKHSKKSQGSKQGSEDVGSFQLRKNNSDKPQGFIDVSIRISQEVEGTSSYFFLGNEDGFNLNSSNGITMATDREALFNLPRNNPYPGIQDPTNYSNPGTSYPPVNNGPYFPSYPPPSHTPQPPPQSYAPSTSSSYINMPSSGVGPSGGPGPGPGPGFGVGLGLGAGALAGGAIIFGDDFMSGFQLPARDASLTISTDPLF